MEEEMDDFEIIDKYLNDELTAGEQQLFNDRYLNDKEFKKEVEVYRKMYEGIKLAGEKQLKNKLDIYYDEFVKAGSQSNIVIAEEEEVKVVPITSWRKRIYVISGIAASACVFAGIIWLNKPKTAPGDLASIVKSDSLKTKPASIPNIAKVPHKHEVTPVTTPDSLHRHPNLYNNDRYAFTSEQRLPATAMHEANYPQPLSYTFVQNTLTIYGDPLLRPIDLKVFKKGGSYYVADNDTAYAISQTAAIKNLVRSAVTFNAGGKTSAEKIEVQLAPIATKMQAQAKFGVILVPGKGAEAFYFTKEKDRGKEKEMLVLQGGFTADNCTVVRLTKDGQPDWYVLKGQQVFILTDEPDKPQPLKELSDMSSSAARLFIKRNLIEKTVILADR